MAERERRDAEVGTEDVAQEAPSAAVQPMSEAERLKKKREALLLESEELRGLRRNNEQALLVQGHDENIKTAQETYQVPAGAFEDLTLDEQTRWNQRRTSIDQANRAYHLAVRRLMAEHADEDQYLAQQRTAQS